MTRFQTAPRAAHHPIATAIRLALTLAMAPVSLLAVPVANAQSQQSLQTFDIPAGPLGASLTRIAEQGGLLLSFEPALVEGRAAPAIRGAMTPQQALQQALAGSGLEVVTGSSGGYRLQRADSVTLAPVMVSAGTLGAISEGTRSYTTGAVTIGKSELSIRETPHSVSVITRQRLDDQNITTIPEALKYTTGVTVQRFDGANLFNNYYVRGYQVDSILLDGVPFGNTGNVTEIDAAMYDRIEVLRGPAGLYQGAGEPSAAINLARKRALKSAQLSGRVNVGSWDAYRMEIDGTTPLNADGSLRGRVVAVADDRDSFLDVVESSKRMLYGTLEFDLSESTIVAVGATRQEIDSVIDQGLPAYANGELLDVKRSTFIGADWNKLDTEFTDMFAEIEHHLASGGRLKLIAREVDRDMLYRVARANTAVSALGTTALQLGEFSPDREGTSVDAYADLPFNAFGHTHNFIAGYGWRTQDEYSKQSPFTVSGSMNVFDPNHAVPKPAFPVTSRSSTESDQSGFYSQVRLRVLDPLTLVLGGRLSDWESESRNEITGVVTSEYEVDDEFTPYGAVILDATEQVSVYASYADTFVPQNSVDDAGRQLEPRVGKQYEVGAKGEFADGRLNVQVAVFTLRDENRALPAPTANNPSAMIAAGEVSSDGWEFEVSGELAPGWDLTFGYTRVDTEYVDAIPTQEGLSFAPFTPRHSANLWTQYRFSSPALTGLSIGGGAKAVSSFYSQSGAVRFEADAYTTVAAQVGYEFNEHWGVNLTANNLFDENYYEKVSGAGRQNFYGEPRSLTLSVRASLF